MGKLRLASKTLNPRRLSMSTRSESCSRTVALTSFAEESADIYFHVKAEGGVAHEAHMNAPGGGPSRSVIAPTREDAVL